MILVAACVVAIAGAGQISEPRAAQQMDAELIFLLRGMALIKAMLVAPLLAALLWRFGHTISNKFTATYIASAAILCGATMLIWQLQYIGAAAILFHIAGFALLFLALKDGKATGRMILPGRRAR